MKHEPFLELETVGDLDRLLRDPTPVMLFKHSTRCPISSHALDAFLAWLGGEGGAVRAALVKVVENRAVSDEIARRLGVDHASPQAILVARGEALWSETHDAITEASLRDALAAL